MYDVMLTALLLRHGLRPSRPATARKADARTEDAFYRTYADHWFVLPDPMSGPADRGTKATRSDTARSGRRRPMVRLPSLGHLFARHSHRGC